ncbi:MAG: alpha/beta hydrolase [Solirubrobacteraceae bacterium]|nr:alpha/beta hydrolase [Solirubrobacteraceae bacterium]
MTSTDLPPVPPEPDRLTTPDGRGIAYRRVPGRAPGVVFLHGYMSTMDGDKALALERHCRDRGVAFLRYDQAGHGASSGTIVDATIGGWVDDAVAVLDALTDGPQILVGSSMGGGVMLPVALARPERVAGLIGIAAAPDVFAERFASLSDEDRRDLERDGLLRRPSRYDPNGYVYGRALLEDAPRRCLLGGPIAIDIPVRLLHGRRDEDVSWETSRRLADALTSDDVHLEVIEDGDHRLSRPQDLERLLRTVDDVRDLAGRATRYRAR